MSARMVRRERGVSTSPPPTSRRRSRRSPPEGVRPDKGPTDTFYGMREIGVVDPDGHRVCLAQDVGGDPLATAESWPGLLDVGSA